MHDFAFNNCRIFLEERMREYPENSELIKAYVTLIENKARFDVAFFSQNADVQKNWSDNQREMNKSWLSANVDVTKKHIEYGQLGPFQSAPAIGNGVY